MSLPCPDRVSELPILFGMSTWLPAPTSEDTARTAARVSDLLEDPRRRGRCTTCTPTAPPVASPHSARESTEEIDMLN